MERGRSDYLRLLGIHHRELAAEGLAFAVRRMEIDFLSAGGDRRRADRSDDRAREIGGARIVLAQEVLRGDEAPGDGRRSRSR